MRPGQAITAWILILIGIGLIIVALISNFKNGGFVALIWGIPILIIGLFILFNKHEDKIEEIRGFRVKGGS